MLSWKFPIFLSDEFFDFTILVSYLSRCFSSRQRNGYNPGIKWWKLVVLFVERNFFEQVLLFSCVFKINWRKVFLLYYILIFYWKKSTILFLSYIFCEVSIRIQWENDQIVDCFTLEDIVTTKISVQRENKCFQRSKVQNITQIMIN